MGTRKPPTALTREAPLVEPTPQAAPEAQPVADMHVEPNTDPAMTSTTPPPATTPPPL